MVRSLASSLFFAALSFLAACGGEDAPGIEQPGPPLEQPLRAFDVRVENHAPWAYAKSGVFNVPVGRDRPGPIRSGDAYEVTFTAGKQHRLSFVTMLGASNDWFFGTAPEGIALYTDGVPFYGELLLHLYDAGTEVDEEPSVGASTGPKQSSPDQGAPDPIGRVRELINPITLSSGATFVAPAAQNVLRATLSPTGVDREFKLRIENISQADTLMTSEGPKGVGCSPGVYVLHTAPNPLFTLDSADRGHGLELIAESGRVQLLADYATANTGIATPFSPIFYVVHDQPLEPIFTLGEVDRGAGLEAIAESGNASSLSDNFTRTLPIGAKSFGVVNTPRGASNPGPVRPGQAYQFTIEARPGDRLSLVSMYGVSNDWIVATRDDGIALFDSNGRPRTGDATRELAFADVGTELDEELGVGAHTGPNQAAPDSGELDPMRSVRWIGSDRYDFTVSDHLALEITTGDPQ